MRRRKRFTEEINLTPLLDVLFVVLFIVMLTGAETQARQEETAEKLQQEVTETKEALRETSEKLSEADDRLKSFDTADAALTLITLENERVDENNYLYMYEGADLREMQRIPLKNSEDMLSVIQENIVSTLRRVSAENPDKVVFVVFNCDEDIIHNKEYGAIVSALESHERVASDFFFKVVEKEKG